jgi:predicted glutamine amidotransferase
MCRLTAYLGPEIALERIIVTPAHSLLEQSHSATEAKLAVNGDGFGVSWYTDDPTPGLYRDVLPAWSDGNLTSLCRIIKSRLFLAHVRASTVGEVTRVNCHPFTHKTWSFAHNGQIADFARIRRRLETLLPDDLYNLRRGTTDSEVFFLLCITFGLDQDPFAAVHKTLDLIRSYQTADSGCNRLTCVLTNGETLYGFSHACDHASPSLYLSKKLRASGTALASEPLDGDPENWTRVQEDEFIAIRPGDAGLSVTRRSLSQTAAAC